MKVLITGGAGFISFHISEGLLKKGDEKKELEDLIEKKGIEEVMVAIVAPVDSTLQRVKEVCQRKGIRLSRVSTSVEVNVDREDVLH